MTHRPRVLLAIGDPGCSALVGGALEPGPYAIRRCEPDRNIAHEVTAFRPDLVIVDAVNGDAERLVAAVHNTQASGGPLVLCAIGGPRVERMRALEAGADACIDKPFEAEEIAVHVRALLRRAPRVGRTVHQLGRLVVDVTAHLTMFDDKPINLTAKEFDILAILAAHAGAVISKATLLERIWGFDAYDENLVEAHVSGLRRQLPPDCRQMIKTIRGVGYVLRDDIPQVELS